jgi:hypothetical protein
MKLPIDPTARRVILAIPHNKIPSSAGLLNEAGVAVMPLPIDRNDVLACAVAQQAALAGSAVLVQSPFDPDHYVTEEDARDAFAREKHGIFAELCALLGAVECCSEEQLDNENQKRTSIKGGAEVGIYSGDAEYRTNAHDAARSMWNQRWEFSGGQPDLVGARELLRKRGLEREPTMCALITARTNSNKVLRHELNLDLLSESKNQMDVIARLKNHVALAQLSLKVKTNIESSQRLRLRMQVRFQDPKPLSLGDRLKGFFK